MFSSIIIVAVIALLLGSVPIWPYSRSWGYYPSGWFGFALTILFILFMVGKI